MPRLKIDIVVQSHQIVNKRESNESHLLCCQKIQHRRRYAYSVQTKQITHFVRGNLQQRHIVNFAFAECGTRLCVNTQCRFFQETLNSSLSSRQCINDNNPAIKRHCWHSSDSRRIHLHIQFFHIRCEGNHLSTNMQIFRSFTTSLASHLNPKLTTHETCLENFASKFFIKEPI